MRQENSNPSPLWEHASQARLSSFWCKKTKTHKQKNLARMKSLLVKTKFYNFKLLLVLGSSRTKEAMLGNDSFWCRGTIWGEILLTVFPKGCLKIFYRHICICFLLMSVTYRQTSCWQLSLSMTYLFSEDTLMSSPEFGPGTGILPGAAGSRPVAQGRVWEIKIIL